MQKVLTIFLLSLLSLFTGSYCYAQTFNKVTKPARVYIKKCADSINLLNQNDSIPTFVFNTIFDYQSGYWHDPHHPIPLRKLVVEKIKNRVAIARILDTKDERLYKKHLVVRDTIGLVYYVMPYIEKSFGELLEDRAG